MKFFQTVTHPAAERTVADLTVGDILISHENMGRVLRMEPTKLYNAPAVRLFCDRGTIVLYSCVGIVPVAH